MDAHIQVVQVLKVVVGEGGVPVRVGGVFLLHLVDVFQYFLSAYLEFIWVCDQKVKCVVQHHCSGLGGSNHENSALVNYHLVLVPEELILEEDGEEVALALEIRLLHLLPPLLDHDLDVLPQLFRVLLDFFFGSKICIVKALEK